MSSYQGFLIANYATGFDREVQPWLLPGDAQFQLLDGFVYRGVWQKREGYSQYAHGQVGGAPYCESRMVHNIPSTSLSGAINGTNQVFTGNLTTPVRRGTVTISGSNPVQAFTDDGSGAFFNGMTQIGTIDYGTGALSITLPTAPLSGTVIVDYDYHQGLPVMGVMNFYREQDLEMIVADTNYVNRYDPTMNRLEDISPSYLLKGSKFNFFSWTNYNDPNDNNRLLFVNNVEGIQKYDGTTVSPYPVYTVQGSPLTGQAFSTGNGTIGPYDGSTPTNTGILRGATVSVTDGTQTITFDQFGVASGDGTGTIDFLTGDISVIFDSVVAGATPITFSYTSLTIPIDTCLHIFQLKDRLVLLRPKINGKTYNKRIMISGTGAFCDTFTTAAIGAGTIDIPDNSYIVSADFNRDDLLIFTALSTWILKYTSNDVVPFALDKIDNSRGSDAPFGSISYLNTTSTLSTRGFIACDGYTVSRTDDKLPDYSYNQINQDNFSLCFAGTVDVDRDHYLIHPSASLIDSTAKSDLILVYNYEELNYSVYRIPLSCMGTFEESNTVTWNDLSIYSTWQEMAAVYNNWNAFTFNRGSPISIGGGHEGQIFQLNVTEAEDYDVRIYDIVVLDAKTIRVTTDFQNYQINDYVLIDGVNGMVQANDLQGIVIARTDYTVDLLLPVSTGPFTTYTDGGQAYKVIIFDSTTKKLNPFAETDKKVRCGWMYFYVSTTDTNLTDKIYIQNATQATADDPVVITIAGHNYRNNTLIQISGVQGMVELNGNSYFITVIDDNTFILNDTAGTLLTPYTAGGLCATPTLAKLTVNCIVNDRPGVVVMNGFDPVPFEVNLEDTDQQEGEKKWYKLWINQVGKFVQFQVISRQAGCNAKIQAMMPGLAPVGRLI